MQSNLSLHFQAIYELYLQTYSKRTLTNDILNTYKY